jgi:hypothetical protein
MAAGLALSAGAVGTSTAAAASSKPGVTAGFGMSRPLPQGFFGINYDYGGAPVYVKDGSVAQQLAAAEPGTLRWPGGTSSNYFQWQKGYPVPEGTGKCRPSECQTDGFRFTLADLAAAYRSTGATPIFDLNVMTSTLAQQIDMLKTAQNTDQLPVKYVELGNEFYLSRADYRKAFPTAGDYGKAVAADVKALHKAFPGVLVAAVGSSGTGSARAAGWNAGMLEEATGAGQPDAVTLHDHPAYDQSLTVSGLPDLFTEAYTSAASISQVTREFPGTPAWITEYGLSLHSTASNPAQLTYANALFEAEAAMLLAQKVSDATLVDYWAGFGPGLNYAYTSSGLTPAGLAMTWLDEAARGARTGTQITFPGGPALAPGGDPALVGESFSGTGTRGEMLINLSGSPVTIAAGTAIPAGAPYRQATGQPTSQIATAAQLTITSGTIGRSLVLAPYSMTVIS